MQDTINHSVTEALCNYEHVSIPMLISTPPLRHFIIDNCKLKQPRTENKWALRSENKWWFTLPWSQYFLCTSPVRLEKFKNFQNLKCIFIVFENPKFKFIVFKNSKIQIFKNFKYLKRIVWNMKRDALNHEMNFIASTANFNEGYC